jgi:hypothetical protein
VEDITVTRKSNRSATIPSTNSPTTRNPSKFHQMRPHFARQSIAVSTTRR